MHVHTSNIPTRRHGRRSRLLLGAGLAGLSVLGVGATFQPPTDQEQKPQQNRPVRVFVSEVATAQDGARRSHRLKMDYQFEGKTLEVVLTNGEPVSVIIDGLTIPGDRLRKVEGQLILLDEEGNEYHTLELVSGFRQDVMLQMFEGPGGPMNPLSLTLGQNESLGWISNATAFEFKHAPPTVMLGLYTIETDPALEVHLGLEAQATVMITGVHEDLAAEQAGLGQYDIILSIDGVAPVSRRMMRESLVDKIPGDEIEFEVIQAGNERTILVTAAPFDPQRMMTARLIGDAPFGPGLVHFDPLRRGRFGPGRNNRFIITPDGRNIFKLSEGDLNLRGEITAMIRQIRTSEEGTMQEVEIKLEQIQEKLRDLRQGSEPEESDGP